MSSHVRPSSSTLYSPITPELFSSSPSPSPSLSPLSGPVDISSTDNDNSESSESLSLLQRANIHNQNYQNNNPSVHSLSISHHDKYHDSSSISSFPSSSLVSPPFLRPLLSLPFLPLSLLLFLFILLLIDFIVRPPHGILRYRWLLGGEEFSREKCGWDYEAKWNIGWGSGENIVGMTERGGRGQNIFDVIKGDKDTIPTPFLTCEETDIHPPSSFVADPFLVFGHQVQSDHNVSLISPSHDSDPLLFAKMTRYHNDLSEYYFPRNAHNFPSSEYFLYVFYEIKNLLRGIGEIGVSASKDYGATWTYLGVSLSLSNCHLSYPFTFYSHDIHQWVMIPETNQLSEVSIYSTEKRNFPLGFKKLKVKLYGQKCVDTSPVLYYGKWYIYVTYNSNLYLYYTLSSNIVDDEWLPHPSSPVVISNRRHFRSAGRPIIFDNQIFRFSQNGVNFYGENVNVIRVSELSEIHYREEEVREWKGMDGGWNEKRFHHVDTHIMPPIPPSLIDSQSSLSSSSSSSSSHSLKYISVMDGDSQYDDFHFYRREGTFYYFKRVLFGTILVLHTMILLTYNYSIKDVSHIALSLYPSSIRHHVDPNYFVFQTPSPSRLSYWVRYSIHFMVTTTVHVWAFVLLYLYQLFYPLDYWISTKIIFPYVWPTLSLWYRKYITNNPLRQYSYSVITAFSSSPLHPLTLSSSFRRLPLLMKIFFLLLPFLSFIALIEFLPFYLPSPHSSSLLLCWSPLSLSPSLSTHSLPSLSYTSLLFPWRNHYTAECIADHDGINKDRVKSIDANDVVMMRERTLTMSELESPLFRYAKFNVSSFIPNTQILSSPSPPSSLPFHYIPSFTLLSIASPFTFSSVQSLISTLHLHSPSATLTLFDIGLSPIQRSSLLCVKNVILYNWNTLWETGRDEYHNVEITKEWANMVQKDDNIVSLRLWDNDSLKFIMMETLWRMKKGSGSEEAPQQQSVTIPKDVLWIDEMIVVKSPNGLSELTKKLFINNYVLLTHQDAEEIQSLINHKEYQKDQKGINDDETVIPFTPITSTLFGFTYHSPAYHSIFTPIIHCILNPQCFSPLPNLPLSSFISSISSPSSYSSLIHYESLSSLYFSSSEYLLSEYTRKSGRIPFSLSTILSYNTFIYPPSTVFPTSFSLSLPPLLFQYPIPSSMDFSSSPNHNHFISPPLISYISFNLSRPIHECMKKTQRESILFAPIEKENNKESDEYIHRMISEQKGKVILSSRVIPYIISLSSSLSIFSLWDQLMTTCNPNVGPSKHLSDSSPCGQSVRKYYSVVFLSYNEKYYDENMKDGDGDGMTWRNYLHPKLYFLSHYFILYFALTVVITIAIYRFFLLSYPVYRSIYASLASLSFSSYILLSLLLIISLFPRIYFPLLIHHGSFAPHIVHFLTHPHRVEYDKSLILSPPPSPSSSPPPSPSVFSQCPHWSLSCVLSSHYHPSSRVVFTLTAMPHHVEFITETLDSLVSQTFPPSAIHLNLPIVSKRSGKSYDPLPKWLDVKSEENQNKYSENILPLHSHPFVVSSHVTNYKGIPLFLNRGKDVGPLTKLLYTIFMEPSPSTLIITVDNDKTYPAHLSLQLSYHMEMDYHLSSSPSAYSACGWKFIWQEDPVGVVPLYIPWSMRGGDGVNVDVLQAVCGNIYRREYFRDNDLHLLGTSSSQCFTTDDIWIAGYLATRGGNATHRSPHPIHRVIIPGGMTMWSEESMEPTTAKWKNDLDGDSSWALSSQNVKPGVDALCIQSIERIMGPWRRERRGDVVEGQKEGEGEQNK